MLMWECPRCPASYVHARFLITHLRELHALTGENDPEIALMEAVEAEGDALERGPLDGLIAAFDAERARIERRRS